MRGVSHCVLIIASSSTPFANYSWEHLVYIGWQDFVASRIIMPSYSCIPSNNFIILTTNIYWACLLYELDSVLVPHILEIISSLNNPMRSELLLKFYTWLHWNQSGQITCPRSCTHNSRARIGIQVSLQITRLDHTSILLSYNITWLMIKFKSWFYINLPYFSNI